jgi:N-acetyl-gamma-glutamyl-phosphate reductase
MKHVFIDGSSGTTGLRLAERLAGRSDISLIKLPEEERKDPARRAEAMAAADAVFLCLPDAAAREAAAMLGDSNVLVLDTSTAHRTAPGWVYGFPELSPEQEAAVRTAKRIAVPGCHASGFIALVAPLVRAGILPPTARLCCHSLTGYSGGGKKMIAAYRDTDRSPLLDAPRQYGLLQNHKHLPEMQRMTGLTSMPAFCPIVGDFYSGMEVTVPLFADQLAPGTTAERIREVYRATYDGYPKDSLVSCRDLSEEGFLSAAALSGRDDMAVWAYGEGDRILLCAVYDNLGKGASGAALECFNLAMGEDRLNGLELN